jgi:aspartate racemase
MSDLQSRITALSTAKRALLERKLRDKAQREEVEPIQPRSSAGSAPLSFGQQRLWFLDQWEPGNPAYNTPILFRIEGPLDAAALDRSLTEISRRHEALRTTFAGDGETTVQIIHPPEPMTAQRLDLTHCAPGQKDAEASRLTVEESARAFDLVKGPIWRATLLQLEPQTHLLLLTVHHIVFDGWSIGVLHRELFTLYEAFVSGESSPLAELPIQYADFAVWQRRRMQGDVATRQLDYWRHQLRDLSTLHLPSDHPRPPVQIFTGAVQQIHLPLSLVEGLKSVTRRAAGTLFMTCLAAFQTLLHRYSEQADIAVGTPIAGRTRMELEELIGFFVNMLVLRADASGDPTFREFLGRVGRVAFEGYAHQELPFERLVHELRPRRDPSRNPLFQVAFAFQNTPRLSSSLSRLKVTRLTIEKPYTRFDLEVHLQEVDDGLTVAFMYNTALFEAATVVRMAGHFRTLLNAIAENADQRLSQLSLLATNERHQILVDWNQTATNYPRDTCVHVLFEAQAKARPDALAVAFGEQRLTYRQLNERANRLAHHLRALGVGPDVPVGVYLERSIETIVGFLGILKAGGAYLPLDPSYPRGRVAFMLEDAKAPVVLVSRKLGTNVVDGHANVVCLDHDFDDSSPDNPSSGATATNLAYVMYTSGSTGHPKGVSIPHRGVVRLVVDTNYVQLGPSDRIAQASNTSFDASTFEIWGALLNGGSLIGIPHHVLLSPVDFARAINEEKIGTLFLTPALFNQMASEAPTAFRPLRYLLVGGDKCDPKWIKAVLERGAPRCLMNSYGPTEVTTFATWHRIERVSEFATTIPIGRPIANTSVYLLDRHLEPVPVGVIGELYIGGDGLAREYLNRPDLTAERFIRDRFGAEPSARLYKSGDFARYLPDGSIDFVGRVDRQVKIRGFRIELQEIEATLSQHPHVSSSVVIARTTDQSDKSLVAYVVPSHGAEPASEALRAFLRDKLPKYMVPSAFVTVDSLPLTPNGKVDLAALPDPEQHNHSEALRSAEPRTSIEKDLARIWEEVLGLKRVGIHDNFFDLGGHSLLATQVIARIERRFGKTVSVAVLFQSPTIEQLGNILSDERSSDSGSPLIPLRSEGSKLPFFWIHGDSTNVLLPEYLGPDRPVYALEHQAHDGRPALYTQVDAIAKHYVEQLRTIRPHGPYLLGGFSFGAVAAFEMAQQLRRDGEEVALVFMLDPSGTPEALPPVRRTVQQHLRQLAVLGPRQKVDYLLLRLKDRLEDLVDAGAAVIRPTVQRLRLNAWIFSGRRLPPSLRSVYILDVYKDALRSYKPQEYAGPVMIFKSDQILYRPPIHWQELITGPLELCERPGSHTDLTKRAYVDLWATRLKGALDEVG